MREIDKTLRLPSTRHPSASNGVRSHGFTSSRHEAQFHFPAEGRGGFSEAGDGEQGGRNIEHRTSNIEHRTSNIERPRSKVEGRGDLLWDRLRQDNSAEASRPQDAAATVVRASRPRPSSSEIPSSISPLGSDQFLDFIVVAEEEENQLRRCRDEQEGQPLVQTDPALENRPGEATDADA